MINQTLSRAFPAFILAICVLPAIAQRPRTVTEDPNDAANVPPPAPATVKAKYEGGIFGHPNKITGTLTLDADNERIFFTDSKHKELFSIPLGSITGAYGDTHAVQPAAATVISKVPLYGIPASFVKTKVRYLTIQYDDPDSRAAGVTSFRLDSKQILDSVLYTLATKAGLIRRGEIYVRKKV
jgi:hypothetical protein